VRKLGGRIVQLNPLHLEVAALLNGRLFRIPEYQRAYAWGKRQRLDLFNDILDVQRSGREHFMATVVALFREDRLIGASAIPSFFAAGFCNLRYELARQNTR